MTIRGIYKNFIGFATAAMWICVAGCSSEGETIVPPEESTPVRVAAEVARQIYTRSYQEAGPVEEGTFYLTYLLNSNIHNVANVVFNVEGSTPGIGMVFVPSNNNKELKWIEVGGGSTPTFYLDNVKAEYGTDLSTLTEIVFDEASNPFVAGYFDLTQEHPDNDLLWSSELVSRGAKMARFDLHHNMSRVRVKVTVDREYEQEAGDLDLEGATVTISSLVHKPYSYNRLDGTMSLGEDPELNMLTLVEESESGTESYDWSDKGKDGAGNDVYTTYDFVLPPQGLREDDLRPVLTIKLASGATYSGILPHAMEIVDETHPNGGYPVALYFLKEYILTIRTVITETPPQLSFMPVQVVEWVDKGDFTIEAHQAGIYTVEEFMKLIEYYSKNNEYQLVRYGNLNEENTEWTFDFFHSIILDYNQIHGAMKAGGNGQKGFSFNFNGYSIFILQNGEMKQVSPIQLYQIVNGTL